jgi:NitT/TauT family transport system permease protein
VWQIGFAIVVLLIWWLLNLADIGSAILPPMPEVVGHFVSAPWEPDFRAGFGHTVFDALRGLIIATILAVPIGVLIGMFPAVERSTRAVIDFGRSFPVIALLPILVLIIGANPTMKVVAITIACFFPILIQSIYGARRLEPTIVDTVRAYRIPAHLRFARVVLPAAGPYVATGLRIATAVSILVAVGVEIVSLTLGIGREISLSRSYGQTATAFAYIFSAGFLGVAVTLLWDLLEKRLLRWHLRSGVE